MNARRLVAVLALLVTLAPCSAFAGGGFGGGPSPWCVLQFISRAPPPGAQTISPFSTIQPGGFVVVLGQNFGPAPGQLLITLTDFNGNLISTPLKIDSWSDTDVTGTIPLITGVEQQTAWFSVTNLCGVNSATAEIDPLPATFYPNLVMETAVLSSEIPCSMTSRNSGDSCQNIGGMQIPSECLNAGLTFSFGTAPASFFVTGFTGLHMSGWGNGNHGTDSFSLHLHSGWGLHAIDGFIGGGAYGGDYTNLVGLTSQAWGVQWGEQSCDALQYSGQVTIIGPQGVPYGAP
jgi:hypothetical protein